MYVIDGYNLLHTLARHPGALPGDDDRARARLVEMLSALAVRESTTARVFFDGTGGNVSAGDLAAPKVRVTFCGPATGSADDAIVDFVEGHNHPRQLKVVSADREVTNACKLAGARIVHSRDMSETLARMAPAQVERSEPEKPTRGAIGRLEQEMLDEIGEFGEFEREVEDELG